MSNQAVANRYADALFQLAQEKGILEQVNEELQVVKQVVETTPDFLQYLRHPKVSTEEKTAFIQKSFQQSVSETTLHAILLLVKRNRIDILVAMIDTFKALAYEAQNVAEATVYSAAPLSEDEKAQIGKLFAKKAGKAKLLVENIVNSDLLGGLKIRIGDRIYDGSVKAQLERLERQLIAGTR